MDHECKRRQIVQLIQESAKPVPATTKAAVKRITVKGNHAIVADTVIVQTPRSGRRIRLS